MQASSIANVFVSFWYHSKHEVKVKRASAIHMILHSMVIGRILRLSHLRASQSILSSFESVFSPTRSQSHRDMSIHDKTSVENVSSVFKISCYSTLH